MASKLSGNDIQNIASQGAVRSSPLRSNFTALKNKINEVIDALAAAAIGTTNAETTAARPYHASLLDRLDSAWKGQYNFVKSGGVVSLNSNPQKVDVTAGEAKVDGTDVKWNSATSGTIAYTVSNTRYDVVVANSDSTISIVTGTAHATPKFPALATSQKALAVLLVTTSAVSIFYQMASVMDRDLFDGNHYNTTAVTPYGLKRKQIFTANGTWTRPIGIQKVHVTCVGAGGAGGDGGALSTAGGYPGGGGGGGGAGAIIKTNIQVSNDVSITVGATGNTVFGTLTAYAGNAGSVGKTYTEGVHGGAGGLGANGKGISGYSLTAAAGGLYNAGASNPGADGNYGGGAGGGSGANGFNLPGNGGLGGPNNTLGGAGGVATANYQGGSGGGGAAGYDGAGGTGGYWDTSGGNPDSTHLNGIAATSYGAGGGGGGGAYYNPGYPNGTGGAGGPGICIVEWEE